MRMRPKKNRESRLAAVSDLFAVYGENGIIDIKSSFGREGRIKAEIGCGKGRYILAAAKREPESLFLAFEKVPDVAMMAMEKVASAGLRNVRFCVCDAKDIASVLPPDCIETLFLNFSDPWPRARNAKRRLTSPGFLEAYKGLLSDGGRIIFKTDNIGLFEYSLGTFADAGYILSDVCFDLHGDPLLSKDNIMTEYEEKFSSQGYKINYLAASLK